MKSAHLPFLVVLAVRISSSCIATQILATLCYGFVCLSVFPPDFRLCQRWFHFFHWCFCIQDFSPLSWSGSLGYLITHCGLQPCRCAAITCTGIHLPVIYRELLAGRICVPRCCIVGKVSATYVCSLNEPVNLLPFKKVGLDNVESIRPLHFFPEAQGRARNTHLEPSLAVSLEPHLPELPPSCEVD